MIIPINEKPYYNTDAVANSIAANDMMDCYLEPIPGVGFSTRRRPGLIKLGKLNNIPFDGIYYWEAKQWVVGVNEGELYRINPDGGFFKITGDKLLQGTPVIFAAGQDTTGAAWLYMANGRLVYTTGTSVIAPTDTSTPAATHVAWLQSYFLANKANTNQIYFTDTNPSTLLQDNTYWSSTDAPVTTEAKADRLRVLFSAWQELYAWGTEGLEIWQNDGTTPFSPIQGAFSEGGIEAPYTVAIADNTVFALCAIGGARVVVKMQGRNPVVVSDAIASVLASMEKVSDAVGSLISVGGVALYMLQFPTAGQTWVYDYKNDVWGRWSHYNQGEHEQFLGMHSCFAKHWNKHLVCSRVDGTIYEMRRDVFQDDTDDIVSYRRTGWLNEGTHNRKNCNTLTVKIKSGLSDSGKLLVRFRDDGREEWSKYIEVTTGPSGHREFIKRLTRLGTYRSRQYEFRISDGSDLVLVSAESDLQGLSS
jgi:hypothetical protein